MGDRRGRTGCGKGSGRWSGAGRRRGGIDDGVYEDGASRKELVGLGWWLAGCWMVVEPHGWEVVCIDEKGRFVNDVFV